MNGDKFTETVTLKSEIKKFPILYICQKL